MTRLEQIILLNQLKTCNLAIQFGKLNEEKMTKILYIRAETIKKLGL